MRLLEGIESSGIGTWIRESEWGYPIVLIGHTLGMALLAGMTLAFAIDSLRTRNPLRGFMPLVRIAWGGFALSLVSGSILFAGAARRFSAHPMFQLKLAALTAGIVLLYMLSRTAREAGAAPRIRWLGAASIALWTVAIAAGRLMAYIR